MSNVDRFLLHCSLIDGVGPAAVQPLLDVLVHKGDDAVAALYSSSMKDFVYLYGISARSAEILATGLQDSKKLDAECRLLDREKIAWISILDAQYPHYLKNTHLPPIGLYARGDSALLSHDCLVACVGSRDLNAYGEFVANHIASELVSLQSVIVSGGARGIDTIVHKAALHNGGRTIAIIGSGLCEPYPAQNAHLFDAIGDQGGVLVSPFPLNMRALPGNFPARNRIIAGISHATVVIQAARSSGALITAAYALEAGRDVGAVPGRIDDPLAEGCHHLLEQGAFVVTSGQSVLKALGHDIPFYKKKEQTVPLKMAEKNIKKERNFDQKDVVLKDSLDANSLVYLCKQPQLFDDLFALGLWPSEAVLRDELWKLCMSGDIEQNFMGQWSSVNVSL